MLQKFAIIPSHGLSYAVSAFPVKNDTSNRGYNQLVQDNITRFGPEIRNATYIHPHHNLVPFLGMVTDPEALALASEFKPKGSHPNSALVHVYMPGENLRTYYDSGRSMRLNREKLLEGFMGLTSGITHLHSFGLLHRDFCDSNTLISFYDMMCGDYDRVLKAFDYETVGKPGEIDAIWEAGIGTSGFAAPEQYGQIGMFSGSDLDYVKAMELDGVRTSIPLKPRDVPTAATDVYGLTMTFLRLLYREILNAQPPNLKDASLDEVASRIYVNLCTRQHLQSNPALIEALMTGINFSPARRQQSAEQLYNDVASTLLR